ERGVLVDLIVQSLGEDGHTNLGFTVPRSDSAKAEEVVSALAKRFGGDASADPGVAILSVTGVGVRSHTGVGTRVFRALSEAGINVELVGTSEVEMTVVVAGESGAKAVEASLSAFSDVIR
ncbi:unnamed protein product, partial [Ectocarpus sp. 4 AP-2014]